MVRRLGALMVVAGLVLGGWVAWQVWGTNWQSERRHTALVEDATRVWTEPGAAPTIESEYGDVSAVVRIPAFGQDYAVPLLEGTSDEALAAGFGRFADSARPGARGNFALAAHRITHGEPLRDMPGLDVGDEVVVETARATYTYVLDTAGDALEVPFTAGWVLAALPRNPDGGVQPSQADGQRLITLTTCSELFHTDDRLVAFGHLVETEPR
ncbi:class E sortase [Nocardioides currus]|uniref:Class E sortase n=1 Tax=Nocardioides currus TaxID=2133958 RepID=A0A2R7YTZ4_9ACTN|nr:class E sortase [Nocardioides currus]PUA79783.1 class E sortase [Nocardioides currus]